MPPTHSEAQRYICFQCKTTQMLPENPVTGPLTVRMGCKKCGKTVRWMKSTIKHTTDDD